MVKRDDTSATEKLLEMIREEQKGVDSSNPPESDPVEVANLPLTMEKDITPEQKEEKKDTIQGSPETILRQTTPSDKKPEQPRTLSSVSPPLAFLPTGEKDGIGIDIRPDGIALVRVVATKSRFVPQSSQFISFDLEKPLLETGMVTTLIESDWFASFLKKSLSDFCGTAKKTKIWCALPREAVESHNVIIPKVPDKELVNTVFWSAKKEVSFDRNAIILDFEPVKEISSDAGSKLLCLIFLATKREVEGLQKLFNKIGFPLAGLASPATAFGNEIHQGNIQVKDESFAHLSLGEEKSFIELYFRNQLIFSRDIKTGVGSLVDSIIGAAETQEIVIEEQTIRQWLLGTPKEQDTAGRNDFFSTEKDVFSTELPAALRLARQTERTFDYCKNNFSLPRSTMVYLSGLKENGAGLADYMTSETGIECSLYLPETAPSFGSSHLLTAYGMALSNEKTSQNFLHTYEEKERQKNIFHTNKIIAAACIVLLLCCSAFYFTQSHQIAAKKETLATLDKEIKNYSRNMSVTSSPEQLHAKLKQLKTTSANTLLLAERYFPMALIQELTGNLPTELKLIQLDLLPGKDDLESKKKGISSVILSGIVTGQEEQREFLLTKYLRKLSDSSFFSTSKVTKRGKFSYREDNVLGFTISAEIEPSAINLLKREQ